jgi:hypothetical protein
MILMSDNNKIHSRTMEVVGTHSNSSSRVLGDSHSLVEVEDRGLNLSFRYSYCRSVDFVACMFMYVLFKLWSLPIYRTWHDLSLAFVEGAH